MVLGAGGVMLALMQIGNSGEVVTIAALAAVGVVALTALAAHERHTAEPLLPLSLWRNRVVVVGCLAGFANGMLMMSLSPFCRPICKEPWVGARRPPASHSRRPQ